MQRKQAHQDERRLEPEHMPTVHHAHHGQEGLLQHLQLFNVPDIPLPAPNENSWRHVRGGNATGGNASGGSARGGDATGGNDTGGNTVSGSAGR